MRKPEVSFTASAGTADQFPRDGLPEVAFLGRSNVGKSSLLNALTGSANVARVSSRPGRTRTVNFFRVDSELYLVDLPGYGYAEVPRAMREGWERLVTSYLLGRAPLALCVFLVDARHDPMEGDRVLHGFLTGERLPFVVAATKADKLGRGALNQRVHKLRNDVGRDAQAVIGVSGQTGSGTAELWRSIREAAALKRQELKERRSPSLAT